MLLWLGTYWWTDCSPQLLSSLQTFAPATKRGAAIKSAQLVENLQMVQALYVLLLARSYREVPTAGLKKYLGPVLIWTAKCRRSYNFVKISPPTAQLPRQMPPHRTKLRTLSPICVQTCSRCAILDPSLGPSWSQLSTQYPIASFPSHTFSVTFRIFLQLKLPPQWNWLCNARNL